MDERSGGSGNSTPRGYAALRQSTTTTTDDSAVWQPCDEPPTISERVGLPWAIRRAARNTSSVVSFNNIGLNVGANPTNLLRQLRRSIISQNIGHGDANDPVYPPSGYAGRMFELPETAATQHGEPLTEPVWVGQHTPSDMSVDEIMSNERASSIAAGSWDSEKEAWYVRQLASDALLTVYVRIAANNGGSGDGDIEEDLHIDWDHFSGDDAVDSGGGGGGDGGGGGANLVEDASHGVDSVDFPGGGGGGGAGLYDSDGDDSEDNPCGGGGGGGGGDDLQDIPRRGGEGGRDVDVPPIASDAPPPPLPAGLPACRCLFCRKFLNPWFLGPWTVCHGDWVALLPPLCCPQAAESQVIRPPAVGTVRPKPPPPVLVIHPLHPPPKKAPPPPRAPTPEMLQLQTTEDPPAG